MRRDVRARHHDFGRRVPRAGIEMSMARRHHKKGMTLAMVLHPWTPWSLQSLYRASRDLTQRSAAVPHHHATGGHREPVAILHSALSAAATPEAYADDVQKTTPVGRTRTSCHSNQQHRTRTTSDGRRSVRRLRLRSLPKAKHPCRRDQSERSASEDDQGIPVRSPEGKCSADHGAATRRRDGSPDWHVAQPGPRDQRAEHSAHESANDHRQPWRLPSRRNAPHWVHEELEGTKQHHAEISTQAGAANHEPRRDCH